jgi:RNA polymerase sigma-70 factor (ECF subfamily)
MLSVAKHMPDFKYDRKIGSFKAWLLNMARWRITDQFRRRVPVCDSHLTTEEYATTLADVENLPDRKDQDLELIWDAEWKEALFEAAMAKVKRNLNPQHYQVFDLYVHKEWTPQRIAQTVGIAVEQVYVTKNRVSNAIKREVERLMAATG